VIHTGSIQFDWETHRPPERMSFGFFFKPILERLGPCWWVCGYWPMTWPMSEDAQAAVAMIEDDLTPPDTVLPDCAFEIIGDRDQFYGLLERPASAADVENGYRSAARCDDQEWDQLFGRMTIENSARHYEQVVRHVGRHGSHTSRFLDAYPVEFAFLTNDSVWWIATRQGDAIDELASYAARVPGMSFRKTAAFGM
jgi:hypothetical protein